jgi:hypothetical protein
MLVQAHLLAIIEAPGDIDLRFAIRVLEHICHGAAWRARVKAFADRHGFELPESPRGLHHGRACSRSAYRAVESTTRRPEPGYAQYFNVTPYQVLAERG